MQRADCFDLFLSQNGTELLDVPVLNLPPVSLRLPDGALGLIAAGPGHLGRETIHAVELLLCLPSPGGPQHRVIGHHDLLKIRIEHLVNGLQNIRLQRIEFHGRLEYPLTTSRAEDSWISALHGFLLEGCGRFIRQKLGDLINSRVICVANRLGKSCLRFHDSQTAADIHRAHRRHQLPLIGHHVVITSLQCLSDLHPPRIQNGQECDERVIVKPLLFDQSHDIQRLAAQATAREKTVPHHELFQWRPEQQLILRKNRLQIAFQLVPHLPLEAHLILHQETDLFEGGLPFGRLPLAHSLLSHLISNRLHLLVETIPNLLHVLLAFKIANRVEFLANLSHPIARLLHLLPSRIVLIAPHAAERIADR